MWLDLSFLSNAICKYLYPFQLAVYEVSVGLEYLVSSFLSPFITLFCFILFDCHPEVDVLASDDWHSHFRK